jgi:hypothetical protein
MYHHTFVLTAILLTFPVTALAQIDPDPNSVGVYFDTDGNINCLPVVEPGEYGPGFIYVVLLNSSEDCLEIALLLWEFRLEITGPVEVLDYTFIGGGNNYLEPPDFWVGSDVPYSPWGDVFVLMDISVGILGTEPVEFRILPVTEPTIPDYPAIACAEGVYPVFNSTGYDQDGVANVCATINGGCPVDNEESTWGQVKAMYR